MEKRLSPVTVCCKMCGAPYATFLAIITIAVLAIWELYDMAAEMDYCGLEG